jgi:hypothetical protein
LLLEFVGKLEITKSIAANMDPARKPQRICTTRSAINGGLHVEKKARSLSSPCFEVKVCVTLHVKM